MEDFIHQSSEDIDSALINKRAKQVNEIWASCVEEIILEHTNSVFIMHDNGIKRLIVYVDESLYAAELNARRELITLKLLHDHNEKIDDFKIHISKGNYKKNYPYKKKTNYYMEKIPPIMLCEEEIREVEELVSSVKDEKIRKSLKEAILSEKKWRKSKEIDDEKSE